MAIRLSRGNQQIFSSAPMRISGVFIVIGLAMATVMAIESASAKEFIVGGDKGWTNNYDYDAWLIGKEFRVGDQLVFQYTKGAHNVFLVDGMSWLNCIAPLSKKAFSSGHDVINLTSPGSKWFICGVGNHCEKGNQRVGILVLSTLVSPAPASPEDGATRNSAIGLSFSLHGFHHLWMFIAMHIVLTMILS